MQLSKRQERILEIVKKNGPITSEQIAHKLKLARATLRPDMAILTMSGLLEARPRVGYFYSGKSSLRLLAEKLHRIKAGDVMSVPVVVTEHSTVYDAVVTMFIEDVGTLFVLKEAGLLEGVVSRKDLLKITLVGKDVHNLPVGVVMTRMPNVVMADINESVWSAARKIIAHEIDAVPVVKTVSTDGVEEGFEVLGRLSKTSITRIFVELGEANT